MKNSKYFDANKSLNTISTTLHTSQISIAQSAGAKEYIDSFSAEE